MELLKTDLTISDPTYYKVGANPQVVELGDYYYLTIGGQSSPVNPLFLSAIEAIYSVAYGIKFISKAEDNDFVVPKMECYWYVNGGREVQHLFQKTPRNEWMWRIVIRMPDFITHDHFFRAVHNARIKKTELSNFDELKFELIQEGLCAQVLHIGSYDNEGPTIEKLHGFIASQNYQISGYHKEIYLSDPRRVAPEKLKTIIRYQISAK